MDHNDIWARSFGKRARAAYVMPLGLPTLGVFCCPCPPLFNAGAIDLAFAALRSTPTHGRSTPNHARSTLPRRPRAQPKHTKAQPKHPNRNRSTPKHPKPPRSAAEAPHAASPPNITRTLRYRALCGLTWGTPPNRRKAWPKHPEARPSTPKPCRCTSKHSPKRSQSTGKPPRG